MNLKDDIVKHSEPTEESYNYLRSLYMMHGQSVSYQRNLNHSSFSRNKFDDLVYELTKLQPIAAVEESAIVTSAPVRKAQPSPFTSRAPEDTLPKAVTTHKTAPVIISQEDPKLVELRKRKGDLFRQYNVLFHQLPTIKDDVDRRAPIKRIKEIWIEISNIWTAIQEFEKNGFWPEPKNEEKTNVRELSVAELVSKAKNLPTYISRNKRLRDKSATATTKQKYQDLMDKASLELEAVMKRIEEL